MATAAFRSTSKRNSASGGDDVSRSAPSSHRRARSVSRFSHRVPSESVEFVGPTKTPATQTRKKFVNTARGTDFPEISLDDLAIELFSSGERGRNSEVSSGTAASQRRGRSISRQANSRFAGERKSVVAGRSNVGCGSAVTGGKVVSDRRRRSVSVVRYRASDSESDNSENNTREINGKSITSVNKQQAAVRKQVAPSQQRGLRRSSSQRDFLQSNNDYSSHSSVLTDDETWDARYANNGFENLRHINARKESDLRNHLCEATPKEHSHAGDDIRMGAEKVKDNKDLSKLSNGGGLQQTGLNNSTVRRNYSTKLDQSDKRKQELLAQIVLEEQHSLELKKFIGEWIPDAETCVPRRPRPRKRSNDKRRESKILNEEADKIIEDFISSVEDTTDISSFDGDRSDTSSTFGIPARPKDFLMHFGEPEHYRTPTRMGPPPPAEMDDVVFPWLQWETKSVSPPQCKNKNQTPATPTTVLPDTVEESKGEQSNQPNSSRGSWSPALAESFSVDSKMSKTTAKPVETRMRQLLKTVPRRSRADIDDYLASRSNDEILFERLKLRTRISSGGILICESSRGPILL